MPDSVPGVAGVQFVQESGRELEEFVGHVRRLVGPEMIVRLARVAPKGLKRARALEEGSENAS